MAALNSFLLRASINVRALGTIKASRVRGHSLLAQTHRPFHLPIQFRRAISRISATNDEEASAREAAATADTGAPTIFDKIIAKEIPSTIVYEDDKVLAFRDINPEAPVHVLVIPKFRDGLTQLGKDQLGLALVRLENVVRGTTCGAIRHKLIPTPQNLAEARHWDILGELLYAAKIVAEKEGILDGFRVVINSGPAACQSVYHLHLHLLGGRQMKWPPG